MYIVVPTFAELNDFMAMLDARLAQKGSHPVGLVAKKVRKVGSPYKSRPPVNAPVWSINPEYSNGECIIIQFLCPHSCTIRGITCVVNIMHIILLTLSAKLCIAPTYKIHR